MEEIKTNNKNEPLTEDNVKMWKDFEVSPPDMTEKEMETSLTLEANERLTQMYVY